LLPFLIIYPIWFSFLLEAAVEGPDTRYYIFKLGTILLLSLHALTYLSTIWSVDIKCRLRYKRVPDLQKTTHIKVIPHAFTGTRELVPLESKKVDGDVQLSFSFRKLMFIWNTLEEKFEKLSYPTRLTFAEYRKSRGHRSQAEIHAAMQRWGPNRFEVPIPKFLELLKEQLLAPFFCFQVFCVGLWALDEYWYYSLFTLFMLVSFESTVVGQRLRNLRDVRSLHQPKQKLYVYRGGKWELLPGESLVPGDVVSIARPPEGGEDTVVQADMLLLAGTCIVDEAVLTGESTPQWKNPIGEATGDEVDASELSEACALSVKRDKGHVMFGGTKLLQVAGDKQAHIKTPDGGCLALVLRTGFGTAQGRLMRTILYSTERVSANNKETFLFILFLLVWAIAASGYVLYHGLADPDRDRFKLVLNCIMIVTSVIPPELPMELTMAVNASLLALARKRVFCTEPFRIPLAGKVTTCCFDKTGTLTSDHMVLEGVAGLDIHKKSKGTSSSSSSLPLAAAADDDTTTTTTTTTTHKGLVKRADLSQLDRAVLRILACCQSLVQVDEGLVGDPVEKAAMEATGWLCTQDLIKSPPVQGAKETSQIMHRFHFSAALKRMSTVVQTEIEGAAAPSWWVLTKGAPETIKGFLKSIPVTYDAVYKEYASEGARVLAMAYKQLPEDTTPSSLRHTSRDEAESGLIFGGFAIFRSPLKEDSEPTLKALREANHQLAMITGDAPLTACYTAKAVHIVVRPVLILTSTCTNTCTNTGYWQWTSPDDSIAEPFQTNNPEAAWQLVADYDLCVTGDGLSYMVRVGADKLYIPLIQVFARVTPEQKELVVKTMKEAGLGVLMCGDGTNDVGALKGADVGVALLPPPVTKKPKKKKKKKPIASSGGGGGSSGGVGVNGSGQDAEEKDDDDKPIGPGTKLLNDMRRQGRPITPFIQRMAAKMDEMAAPGMDGDVQMVKPGDASMAAPFTAKQSSVGPCMDILKQGRCTLVTTVQMFKVLGLLCLSSAYSLSVMYMDGIKLGDLQATLAGFLTAGMFFFISHSKPLEKMSKQRPHAHVFSAYVFSSLLGQFAIYISFLMYMQYTAHREMDPEDRQLPDTVFKPNLINTICFLVNFIIQTMTFAVNYVGTPFNTPLSENKAFALSVRWSVIMYVLLVFDLPSGLASWFSLVAIPQGMKVQLMSLAVAAYFGADAVEKMARRMFPAEEPPEKGGMVGESVVGGIVGRSSNRKKNE